MNETLAKFWLFATHWTELDVFETEEELNDEIELLHQPDRTRPRNESFKHSSTRRVPSGPVGYEARRGM